MLDFFVANLEFVVRVTGLETAVCNLGFGLVLCASFLCLALVSPTMGLLRRFI